MSKEIGWRETGGKKMYDVRPNTITIQYLVVPRANKGHDAFKWVAFYGSKQTADVPFTYANTPQAALKLLEEKDEMFM